MEKPIDEARAMEFVRAFTGGMGGAETDWPKFAPCAMEVLSEIISRGENKPGRVMMFRFERGQVLVDVFHGGVLFQEAWLVFDISPNGETMKLVEPTKQ